MEHFYQNIQGWADGIDLLYKQIVDQVPENQMVFNGDQFVQQSTRPFHFVEIGSWRGRSSAFMAVEIANSGKNILFDCIDTWRGSVLEEIHQLDPSVINDTLYEEFLSNMKPVEKFYRHFRLTSIEAAKLYEDKSLDFVFIDAGDDYDSVKADIAAWAPKVRHGGLLAGHDFNPATPNNDVERAVLEAYPDVIALPWCWAKKM